MIFDMAENARAGWDRFPRWARSGLAAAFVLLTFGAIGAFAEGFLRWVSSRAQDLGRSDLTGKVAHIWGPGLIVGLLVGAVLIIFHLVVKRTGHPSASPLDRLRKVFVRTRRANRFRRSLFQPLRQWSLLRSVLAMLVVALALVGGAWWLMSILLGTSDTPPQSVEITKVALTIAGGVGASVALVVAYRKQRDTEANRFVERFGAAAAQLGDVDPAVRLAGVYAMATLVDDSPKSQWQQQCVDVLCAYLRMPHDPYSHNNLVEQTRTHTDESDGNLSISDQYRLRYNDNEVRNTIIRIINGRLQPNTEPSWSDLEFDFTDATLQDANFKTCVFNRCVKFDGAKFFGAAVFMGTRFKHTANFTGATFNDYAVFAQDYGSSTPIQFDEAAWFVATCFKKGATWDHAIFGASAAFGSPIKTRPNRTEFQESVFFRDVTFTEQVNFDGVRFGGTATFSDITFGSTTMFTPILEDPPEPVEFMGDVSFREVNFTGRTLFRSAVFHGRADFTQCNFEDTTEFTNAQFQANVDFEYPAFRRSGDFQFATFNGTATFKDPLAWEGMIFDWNDDFSLKPSNVYPIDWPPQ
ncbi:pentapeptide repeat-containing protein (plasmid) [Rhodococcus sp. ZPP]|uniref:pentapeptide repeat-containing protein n=1 Tax=unclassified Rhodococcus (in: high G+C Gram-positive bacteria) TaxID=192944 RepID=UPI00131F9BCF|nr:MULTISPECIES: pentapeptide repeat-containing protein [unclassified Rhodococcus (in: high G+C Gram-positive bacteria)]QHE74119.1 putative telomere-binding protein [Rhodococcus sp. WAY2]QTJ71028.1 pentapeptide repeat-containing protein [Rhodococcus sp. ZPP]